ncbi:TPA: hypothetical protein I8669_002758 [Legionella pneumophila]|nr:hypothetical protein [Legionella pneumophila]
MLEQAREFKIKMAGERERANNLIEAYELYVEAQQMCRVGGRGPKITLDHDRDFNLWIKLDQKIVELEKKLFNF